MASTGSEEPLPSEPSFHSELIRWGVGVYGTLAGIWIFGAAFTRLVA